MPGSRFTLSLFVKTLSIKVSIGLNRDCPISVLPCWFVADDLSPRILRTQGTRVQLAVLTIGSKPKQSAPRSRSETNAVRCGATQKVAAHGRGLFFPAT